MKTPRACAAAWQPPQPPHIGSSQDRVFHVFGEENLQEKNEKWVFSDERLSEKSQCFQWLKDSSRLKIHVAFKSGWRN